MSSHTLVFGPCEVDPALRQVRLHGAVRDVAPKVFGLLLYLIEHRGRVVPKGELLERLWPATVVSESVLARAVMKARSAIGDDGKEPAYIRTVHRVGYRFAAELARAPSAQVALAPDTAPWRIALLPFENRTGEAELAWIDLGLMSLVQHALRPHPRLNMVSATEVLQVLETLGDRAGSHAKARAMEHAFGTDCVVRCIVRREAAVYRLDYESFGSRREVLAGGFSADEPTRLAQQLAEAIEAAVTADAPRPLPLQLSDPLARQALMRALEKEQRGEIVSAARFYDMAIELEPGHPYLMLMATRCVARHDPVASVRMGQRLVDSLEPGAERWLRASAQAALGIALARCDRYDEARPRLDQALSLAHGLEPSSEVATVHQVCAIATERYGDDALSLRHWQTVERMARELRDESMLSVSLNNAGMIQLRAGRLDEARTQIEAALSLARRQGNVVFLLYMLSSMADLHWAEGRLDLAVAHCDEMQPLLARCQYAQPMAIAVFFGAQVHADAFGLAHIDRLLASAAPLRKLADRHVRTSIAAADGVRAACAGDLAQSLDFFATAVSLTDSSWGQQVLHELLPWQATVELRDGRHDSALATLHRIRGLAPFSQQLWLAAFAARVEAGTQHARGDRLGARATLARAVGAMTPTRHAALARLDAAWLALEDDDLQTADTMLLGLGAWSQAHPLGLAVQARRLHADGRHEAAARAQQAGLALLRDGPPPPWLVCAHRSYLEGTSSGRMAPLPRLPSFM